ncbi:MAG TPA: FAD-dependent oxidoreductase [Terriglobales bacterium]|nr:FAD-dependent oxidoreductase [Terriglobales bacterium]
MDEVKMNSVQRVHTVVIGGGQAGLSVGYHLKQRGISFVILDAHARIGDAWRNRWDSLRLFTPGQYISLDGLPYYPNGKPFPTKDDVALYLESYARFFQLPVKTSRRVESVHKENGTFYVRTSNGEQYQAQNVVVAMANYQQPYTPSFAPQLSPYTVQIHSHHYRNPAQLKPGGVLVVGVGNSGADIAIETAKTHPTWIAGKESGHVPFPIDTWLTRHVLFRLVRFIGHHILSLGTPIGRKKRPQFLHEATALIRVKPKDLVNAGIKRVPRVEGVRDGKPLLADGQTLDVENVIWCTGYQTSFPWIHLPVFDEQGDPIHERGVVNKVPGLFFVGLHYLYAMSSATLIGIGRDAQYVVEALAKRKSEVAAESFAVAV